MPNMLFPKSFLAARTPWLVGLERTGRGAAEYFSALRSLTETEGAIPSAGHTSACAQGMASAKEEEEAHIAGRV